jgi:hypothetical protein
VGSQKTNPSHSNNSKTIPKLTPNDGQWCRACKTKLIQANPTNQYEQMQTEACKYKQMQAKTNNNKSNQCDKMQAKQRK